MRINKFIAQAGICSRRKADELIACGKVKVNGAVCREAGFDVSSGDTVEAGGKRVGEKEKLVYYALNKPVGYVSTSSDEKGRPAATDLLSDVPARVYPVGRLDINTSGLLIFTNDGELANRLTHPSGEVKKVYMADLGGRLSPEALQRLSCGVDIGGYVTRPAELEIISSSAARSRVLITISEGKNRQIRRMADAVGLRVLSLTRIAEGPVRLGRLKPGSFRRLTPAELAALKSLTHPDPIVL